MSAYQQEFVRELRAMLHANGGRATPQQLDRVRANVDARITVPELVPAPTRAPRTRSRLDRARRNLVTSELDVVTVERRAQAVAVVQRRFPEAYARVRANCGFAADGIDLDAHAAGIVLITERAKAGGVLQ